MSPDSPVDRSASADISRRTFGRALGAVAATVGLGASPAEAAPQSTARPGALNAVSKDDLCELSALELVARLKRRQVSAREVMSAHLARIERVNPTVNAIVTLAAERAMAAAAKADELAARGTALGPLHGLPVAHKDLVDTAGIRTTRGSRFFQDNVPTVDAPFVARTTAAGAITLGKTNTPEFGAGSQTFNSVFGATRNPYDTTKTCGGSSGGAAVSLACGMVPIAGGSDTGGSLRNPAAFCNIVGFRPSPGRVGGDGGSWSPLSVAGPMARSVSDLALFLSALAGPEPRSPIAIAEDGARFRAPLGRNFKGVRVAWWKGLGGIPIEPEIRHAVDANRRVFEDLGCIVEEAEPDFTGVETAFPALRYTANHARYAPLVKQRAEWVKDTVQYEVAEAERLTGADIGLALERQTRMYAQTRALFDRYEYFVLPVTQVSPFDVTVPYPTEIAGTRMVSYIDWMRSCWYVTFMATPAASVPAGFTASGLPIGIQIVGRHQGDWSVLQMAYAFEQATHHARRRPPVVA
jgi:amidase